MSAALGRDIGNGTGDGQVSNNGFYQGREIPEEVAAQTDIQNDFPAKLWKKFGEAG